MTGIERRVLTDAYNETQKNGEYISHKNKMADLGRKIMECLGNRRLLFLEYERLVGLSEKIYSENVYRIGVSEGTKKQ